MRIALITHGLPPYECTGVETHVAQSAAALARAGHEVLVCARRAAGGQPHLAERREWVGAVRVHWINDAQPTRDATEAQDPPGVLAAFEDLLERERPDLCHFHHLQGFGPACVEAVRRRGIATVFTAHDFAALCHRTAMLRPDLERCERVGDALACARCDLATALLNSTAGLGDWQLGVTPAALAPDQAAALSALLDGPDPEGLERAHATRSALDAERRAALEAVDLVLAPSDLMASRLRALGLCPERIREFACGVDVSLLSSVPPVRVADGEPLRFGFIGGASKHKGLSVLLEAFADLRGAAQLRIFADSTDRPHVALLQQLAEQAGAEWCGAFEAPDLPRVLAEIDVLCVPSQWDENAPFVVREAFAAGRPVVASRLGGLLESVRDGRDGLLVEAANRAAWTRTLESLTADRGRVLALAAGIAPPAEIGEQTRRLVELYTETLERGSTPPAPTLAHLASFEARYRDLDQRPLEELAETVAQGLGRLSAGLSSGPSADPAPPASPPDLDEVLRDRLRDERRRLEWLERGAAQQGREREALQRELEWTRDRLERAESDVLESAGELERTQLERAALGAEHARVVTDVAAREQHAEWLAQQHAELRAGLEQRNAELGERLGPLEELAREAHWRRREMHAARSAGGWLWRALLRRSGLGRRMSGWGDDE